MRISENALNALTACEYCGVGKAWVNKNLRGGETVEPLAAATAELERVRDNIRTAVDNTASGGRAGQEIYVPDRELPQVPVGGRQA